MFLVVFLVVLSFTRADSARVTTALGELEGLSYLTSGKKEIFTFSGVPYAKPPVGKHKFDEPKPARNWTGVWYAINNSPSCIQYDFFSNTTHHITGSEDCLYLNIYTPSISGTSNLPVLVYFHGGAFTFGSNTIFNPNFFTDNHNIVFVSVNYRLGPFGFLSTQNNLLPGNNGLKDQALALKWVQENIALFGGDKNQVTIAGNSAGAASVQFHFLSPISRGLFSKGISSSGSALMSSSLTKEPLLKTKLLAELVGCPINTTEVMVKCLKYRPSTQILQKLPDLLSNLPFSILVPFGPVVENSTRMSFISEEPYQTLMRGDVNEGPWLASITSEEGLYPSARFIDREELLQRLNTNWSEIVPGLLNFYSTLSLHKHSTTSDAIRSFYFGNETISEETNNKLIEMLGDRLFKADIALAARIQASFTKSQVFFYTFAYKGKISYSDNHTKTKKYFGTSHFDDMYYLLALPESRKLTAVEDQSMIHLMTSIWANFIKTGQPTVPQVPKWDSVPQDAFETGVLPHLLIKSPLEIAMVETDDFGNYEFWNSLGFEENKNKFPVTKAKDEL